MDRDDPSAPVVEMVGSQVWRYDRVLQELARKVGHDAHKIQLYRQNQYRDGPGSMISYQPEQMLAQMLGIATISRHGHPPLLNAAAAAAAKQKQKLYYAKVREKEREREKRGE